VHFASRKALPASSTSITTTFVILLLRRAGLKHRLIIALMGYIRLVTPALGVSMGWGLVLFSRMGVTESEMSLEGRLGG
jgi:hypothetical protein